MENVTKQNWRFTAITLTVIGTAAFCVELPFFRYGIPSGHDFEFHFNSWLEVTQHWKEGVLYPHWAALAHYDFGEARFIFYPPLSWFLGGVLGLLLPWKMVPGVYIWIALSLAGVSMFALARQWLSRGDALFAAVFYTINPYHLVIVYWRSALAELLAAAYLPLILLFALRLKEDGRRAVIPLSLLLAAGWLTNVPSAVMMTYSLALLSLCAAIYTRSLAPITFTAASVVVGMLLAAVYLLPAWHQQSWVSLQQVLSPGVRPQDHFLFVMTRNPDHNRFNLVVSVVAVWELVIVAESLFLSRRHAGSLWWALLAWTAFCGLLMIKFTLPLWMRLPELRFVQIPWRWLLCLNVSLALLVVTAFRHWWLRALVCVIALGSVSVGWQQLMAPWWDTVADIREMVDNQKDDVGNEGADEYVPAAADPYAIDQNAPRVRFEGNEEAKIAIQEWHTEEQRVVITTKSPGKLFLRLFNYPSWKVEENGHPAQAETAAQTGQLIVPVAAGEDRIHIKYAEGWDRELGGGISLLTLAAIASRGRLSVVGRRMTRKFLPPGAAKLRADG